MGMRDPLRLKIGPDCLDSLATGADGDHVAAFSNDCRLIPAPFVSQNTIASVYPLVLYIARIACSFSLRVMCSGFFMRMNSSN